MGAVEARTDRTRTTNEKGPWVVRQKLNTSLAYLTNSVCTQLHRQALRHACTASTLCKIHDWPCWPLTL